MSQKLTIQLLLHSNKQSTEFICTEQRRVKEKFIFSLLPNIISDIFCTFTLPIISKVDKLTIYILLLSLPLNVQCP